MCAAHTAAAATHSEAVHARPGAVGVQVNHADLVHAGQADRSAHVHRPGVNCSRDRAAHHICRVVKHGPVLCRSEHEDG
jgi:hypothetical protein